MIYACEHHDAVHDLWRRQDMQGIRLAHVDFHDDLRGLLVDRRRRRAYAIGALARDRSSVDAGNFLAHAVLEGQIERIAWVHDLPGGRAWDAGIVRYESDLFALPQRLAHRLRRGPEVPLEFEELLLATWPGPAPGERLSVDWDCFASILQSPDGVDARVQRFLERLGPVVPPDTYVAYSPEYSVQSLTAFRALLDALATRFGQPVEWLSPDLAAGKLHPTGVNARLPGSLSMRLTLWLRRRGIF